MYSKKNNRISQKTNNHNKSIDVRYNKKISSNNAGKKIRKFTTI